LHSRDTVFQAVSLRSLPGNVPRGYAIQRLSTRLGKRDIMEASPLCPVCESHEWLQIGRHVYRASDVSRLPEAIRPRLRVLFEVWAPRQVEFQATYVACQRCGFVCYLPRPTEDDLVAKYRYLNDAAPSHEDPPPPSAIERARGGSILKALEPHLGAKSRILDYGGGDGRLMAPFLSRGHQCAVIDFSPKPIDGVRYLGATLGDASPGEGYDAVICNHVIEHLAHPFRILVELREWLRPGGVLYVEVPMEIWRRIPVKDEPVTHVNFFTPPSLRSLLERSSYDVLRCRQEAYRHARGHMSTAVRAVARPARRAVSPRYLGVAPTLELLNPGIGRRLAMAWLHPGKTVRRMTRRLSRFVPH